MKRFLAIGLLLAAASVVSGQTNDAPIPAKAVCSLTLAQAGGIGGLRLGMTVEQVLALFPGSREDEEVRAQLSRPASRFGVSSLMINPEKYASRSKFAGVTQITFSFLDGRTSTFNVGYDGPEWQHVDQFVTKFIEGSNLPAADAWEPYVGMDTQLMTLKCKEFEISIFAGGKNVHNINYVQMQDTVAQQKLKERRAKAKQQEKTGAKP